MSCTRCRIYKVNEAVGAVFTEDVGSFLQDTVKTDTTKNMSMNNLLNIMILLVTLLITVFRLQQNLEPVTIDDSFLIFNRQF